MPQAMTHATKPLTRLLPQFATLCLLAILLAGCRKGVFIPTEDRSQFDRFDTSRDERAEPFLEDEYGRKVPNLRGRLIR